MNGEHTCTPCPCPGCDRLTATPGMPCCACLRAPALLAEARERERELALLLVDATQERDGYHRGLMDALVRLEELSAMIPPIREHHQAQGQELAALQAKVADLSERLRRGVRQPDPEVTASAKRIQV